MVIAMARHSVFSVDRELDVCRNVGDLQVDLGRSMIATLMGQAINRQIRRRRKKPTDIPVPRRTSEDGSGTTLKLPATPVISVVGPPAKRLA